MQNFQDLALQPLLATAISVGGYTNLTPIQAQAIPVALKGNDILGRSQTGTRKTLAFGLPIVQAALSRPGKPAPKTVKALILAPTSELVDQISMSLSTLTKMTKLRINSVVGGTSLGKQLNSLSKSTDILVATPGRLIGLLERGGIDLSSTHHLILD